MAKIPVPYRRVAVPNWGEVSVPRHIVRIDIDEPGYAGTHGWQVRYPSGGRSTFFSDGKANPKTRLRDAINYLASIWQGQTPRLHSKELSRKKVKTGMAGVALNFSLRANRRVREIYVVVTPTQRGSKPRKFYVGTTNTVTKERLAAAFAKAAKLRQQRIAAYLRDLSH